MRSSSFICAVISLTVGTQALRAQGPDSTRRDSARTDAAAKPAATKPTATKRSSARSAAAKPTRTKSSTAASKPAISADSLRRLRAIRDSAEYAKLWPVKHAPTPLPGALLPAKRIVAYYGNPLSKRMGILGELPPEQMLARLDKEVTAWNKADPGTPVQP